MSEVGVGAHSVYMDTMTIPIVRLVMPKNEQNLFLSLLKTPREG